MTETENQNKNQSENQDDGLADRVSQIMNQFDLLLASKIAPIHRQTSAGSDRTSDQKIS